MNNNQKKFLLLRADGLSFDKIANKLKVTKKTLIQWSRIYQEDIQDLQFQDMRDLKEQYRYDKKAQYEQLLKQLEKFNKAMDEADLSSTSIKDLHLIRNDIIYKLEQIEARTTYTDTGLTSVCSITGDVEQITMELNEI
ncbi:MAG: hypothetical protein DRG78_10265 [Epsilonproteobacteria bacterium]|nr:MAG: hypothetical protein DRG78_10265 [Campylobacterota bacterium]